MSADSPDFTPLLRRRIVFGHQSVGGEILAGVQDLAEQQGVVVHIQETRHPPAGARGIFHFKVGENGAPAGKIADFVRLWEAEPAPAADIGLMKLCYVDFSEAIDPQRLADEYIAAIERLRSRAPTTTFAAVTAPLTTVQTGPKAWAKRLLGRPAGGYEDNRRRQAFNEILRTRLTAHELFDIAAIEAGRDPRRSTSGGPDVEALQPALTYDGGHLNPLGRRAVAAELIRFLGTLDARM